MKKLIAAALTGALVLGTVGTSVVFAADDDKTITVAASETPHSEILEAAKPILEEEGYDLEVTVFDDYVQPNEVVESGDFDANYFQHIPYLNSFNEEKGTHLVNAGGIHYEPFGIYPGTKSSLDDIADGDTIAVPNDTTNEARALLLLQDNGIIKLKDGAGLEATVNDIEENPYNVEIVELAAEQVARVAEETSYIVLNGNYALQAGYSVSKDALAYETSDSEAAKTYVNVIAVKEGNENSDKIKALVDVLKSDEIKDFIGENGYFSSMFDFEETCYGKSEDGWYASKPYLTPEEYKKCIFHTQKKIGDTGMISNIIENHDEPRGVCHYISPEDRCPDSRKLLAGVYFLLKGIPFIYQGQEIGMENMEFTSMDQIDDISTIDEYQVALRAGCSEKEALDAASAFSRDNARTPVQWSAEKNAGFSEGEPWLGVNPNYKEINVKSQLTDSDSLLSFYKKLTALRKAPEYKETLVYGTFAPYQEEQKNLIAYTRNGEKNLLILGNMQAQSQKVSLPGEVKEVLLNNQKAVEITEKEIILKPYQFIVLETADECGVRTAEKKTIAI